MSTSLSAVKNFGSRQVPTVPADYIPRGSPALAAARGDRDYDAAPAAELFVDRPLRAVSLLEQGTRKAKLLTK